MDNALSLIQGWIKSSKYKVTIVPRSNRDYNCDEVLGITEHSVLGSIINGVGGISISNNLLRHYGGENRFGLSVRLINQVENKRPTFINGQLIIADDAYGGLFSININSEIGTVGNIMYLSPDSYIWENLEVGHSAFVRWSLTGDLELFYKTIREKTKVTNITCDFSETYSFTPPLWIKAKDHKCTKTNSNNALLIRSQMLLQL